MKEREDVTLRPGISTCLLGEEVRYDDGHKLDRWITSICTSKWRTDQSQKGGKHDPQSMVRSA